MQKYIITKYAMTTGVFVASGAVEHDKHPMIKVAAKYGGYYHKPDWHTTIEDAVDRMQAMRESALKSLRKKIAKLEALDIEAAVREAVTVVP